MWSIRRASLRTLNRRVTSNRRPNGYRTPYSSNATQSKLQHPARRKVLRPITIYSLGSSTKRLGHYTRRSKQSPTTYLGFVSTHGKDSRVRRHLCSSKRQWRYGHNLQERRVRYRTIRSEREMHGSQCGGTYDV